VCFALLALLALLARFRDPQAFAFYGFITHAGFEGADSISATAGVPDHSLKIYWLNEASLSAAKRFVTVHAAVSKLFNLGRYLVSASRIRVDTGKFEGGPYLSN